MIARSTFCDYSTYLSKNSREISYVSDKRMACRTELNKSIKRAGLRTTQGINTRAKNVRLVVQSELSPLQSRIKDVHLLRRQAILSSVLGVGSLYSGIFPGCEPASARVEPFCGAFQDQVIPEYVYRLPWDEKMIKVDGGEIWARIVGEKSKRKRDQGKLPILCIHGGPGVSSRYLEPLELLASTGHRVIFYDQAGCGFSTPGKSSPTMDTLTREIDEVRQAFGLKETKIHIFGHGAGGMLALNYILSDPARSASVASMTLAGTAPSLERLVSDRRMNLAQLDPTVQNVLDSEESAELRASSAWIESRRLYARKFEARKLPGCVSETWQPPMFSLAAQQALVGQAPFVRPGGSLEGWNVEDQLKEINTPVYLTRGQSDEVSENTIDFLRSQLPNVYKVETFDGGSCSHIDDWEAYLEALENFVTFAEKSQVTDA